MSQLTHGQNCWQLLLPTMLVKKMKSFTGVTKKEQFTTATLKAKPIAAEEPPKLKTHPVFIICESM